MGHSMAIRAKGEGSIYQVKATGRWTGVITLDGRRRTVKAATKTAVAKRLDALKSAAEEGRTVVDGNMTVGELVKTYEAKALGAHGRAVATVESHKWALKLMTDQLGTRRLRDLRVDDVEDALERTELSHESLVKVRSVLAQAFDWGVRRRLLDYNPVRIAEIPLGRARTEEGRSLTVDQARALVIAIHGDRLEALWLLMLGCGLRPGEARALTWTATDMQNRRVKVQKSLRLDKFGLPVFSDETKTKKSRRTLDMPPFVFQVVGAHRQRQREERMAIGARWPKEWADLVFVTTKGTPIDRHNLRRAFGQLTTSAGLGRWHPNELRHSAASIMNDAGVPLEHIADILGHVNTSMLAKTYRHAIAPSIGHGTKAMQDVLGEVGR
jgi:integrase